MAGLEPAIHPSSKTPLRSSMDARIKSGHDEYVCFDISILETRPHSRGARGARVVRNSCPSKERAQGMPGAQPHPQPRMRNKKAYERSHHRFAETARHSLHDGVTVSFVLSPVNRAFCHRRLSIISTSLTPASGRQDHTTSPSASWHHSSADAGSRPSHPRPTSVTIAIRPSYRGRDGGDS